MLRDLRFRITQDYSMKTFIKRAGLRKKIKKEKKLFSFSYQGRDQNTNL